MTKACFSRVKISGVVTVVPPKRIRLDDEIRYYADAPEKLEKLKSAVGLNERCVVEGGTTPADLCEEAARRLIEGTGMTPKDFDALVCVLDFPDYRCPPTACVLHGKLGMPETCMAFDITHGCAGYVYGLQVVSAMIESRMCERVLLLVGDTKSRTINIGDRISAPLFGDGAAATVVERSADEMMSFFVSGTDGGSYENIIVPAGGARLPCTEETRRERADAFGNVRSLENFTMNGRAVFDFTIKTVPENLKETLAFANETAESVDFLVLHQANKSIIRNVAARAGFKDLSKVPTETLARYGNLAVASIPSVLNDRLFDVLTTRACKLLISGFGVGLSWGSAVLNTNALYCPRPFVYGGEK